MAKPQHRAQHVRHQAKAKPKPAQVAPTLPAVTTPAPATKNAGLVSSPVSASRGGSTSRLRPLIILALCLSFALFAAAATPAHVLPWRRGEYFLATKHVEFTMLGVVLLFAAGLAILLTRG